MSIETPDELERLKAAGAVVAAAIRAMRRLRRGDLVKLDVTAELDGFYADACVSVPVLPAAPAALRLIAATRDALNRALRIARAGTPINQIGRTVEGAVAGRGYAVCAELTGHGIGRRIHEWPQIPNYDAPDARTELTDGLVITIEPITSAGSGAVHRARDGWTIKTTDGALSAHAEHTIVVTNNHPVVLTA